MRRNHAAALAAALDSLVGPGAQLEHYCDESEHDDDSECIFCEARAALRAYRAPGCLHWADSAEPIDGGDGPCVDCGRYYVEQE